MPLPLVVGFDLDMTLLDSRPGVAATFAALTRETGVFVDGDLAASRLGPPLETELAYWAPPDRIPALAERYRELYVTHAVPLSLPLPGAVDAVRAVHRAGGRVVVVTAKNEAAARLALDAIGLGDGGGQPIDEVVGHRWAAAKGAALAEHGADVYVGDHVDDIAGARAGGAVAVSVATGPCPADSLAAAGADAVLADLTAFAAWLSSYLLPGRLADLETRLRGLGSVLVAFSGGADSAFVLAAAVRALGAERVVAATAVSAALPPGELDAARAFTAALGVRHELPATDEMARDGYRANGADRCAFCKAELLDVLGPLAARLGLAAVATGTNADDAIAGFRPGIRAAAERGAVAPLRDAGLAKDQVRAASRQWELPTWDKPASACLSSRVAYGIEISPARLERVGRAEADLRAAMTAAGLAVRNLRVRDLGDRARVEVDRALVTALRDRPDVLAAVRGFGAVEVDERGFRSGAMNELLPVPTSS